MLSNGAFSKEDTMRRRIFSSLYALVFLVILLGLSVFLEGCSDKCEVQNEYVYFEPVYTSLEDVRIVSTESPRDISAAGKIYIKGNLLFVNEPGQGIHVIDNADPTAPVKKSFIKIPGNFDMAVKGNSLYADSFVDLVVLDISDAGNIREVNRLKNTFTNYNTLGFSVDQQRGVITSWEEKKEVRIYKSDCEVQMQPWGGFLFQEGVAFAATDAANFSKSAAIAPGNGSVSGVGGSMARFTINSDYLYTLDGGDVQAINIMSEQNPVAETRTQVAWDMETIFPYKQNLFIGSMSGMHILDVSTPASPKKISTYQHVRVCDPVVVQDDIAFVTLRSGTQCQGFTNQLEVIDIQNLEQPQLLHVYPMTNPHGLGVDGSTLFVCDGDDGLKVYDAANLSEIDKNQLAHYKGINTYDVIPFNNVLIMTGNDGIFQYDYSNPRQIKLLSKIQVVDAN
jgi:hypothetical protein